MSEDIKLVDTPKETVLIVTANPTVIYNIYILKGVMFCKARDTIL